ncbi:MAG: gamma carbonic anhydrase family protein [Halanaerobiaceae bacterium]
MIHNFDGDIPEIEEKVFLAPGAHIIGDVHIYEKVSIWHNAVIRGDLASIEIKSNTNIQENSTIHVDKNYPVFIGKNVTVGHNSIIHGCTIEKNCLIGMGATILSGAHIKEGSIIGAGALVIENQIIPPRSLIVGLPGKVKRKITEKETDKIKHSADHYCQLALTYLEDN